MSTLRRSATGCTRCKTRRKKCDETKPECLRCLSSGNPCNYEYIEYPESDAYRVIRTKPAPRSARELLARASRNLPTRVSVTPAFVSSDSGDSTVLLRPVADQPHINEIGVHRISTDSGLILYNPSVPLLTSSDLVQGPDVVQHTHDTDPITSGSASQVTANRNPGERTQMLLYTAPTVDRNIEQNALPFVLQCYAQWAAAVIFEPSKIMPAMRDRVFAQFASENKRTNSILIANVMNMFVKGLATNRARTPILDQLASSVQTNGAVFIASPPSPVPALERQNAANILDNMLEIITLLIHTRPSSEFTQLLQGAAGVFRRACPGPPGRPVNLSAVLLDFNINLRHFATIDIVKHIATGLPTCFLYEVPFSLELCDRIYHLQLQGNYGLQWVYGIPDQFILLIAWINTLSQTLDDDDHHSELVAWVEQVLPQIKVAIDDLGDPALHMVNLGIFESWRLTVQIYLYMVLCKADAHDPRVVQTQRSFMRLIRGIKPGRHPDVYLILQIGMVGIVTVEERHRGVLLRRILGVQGYAEKGTAPNDTLLILKDIWARTKDEGRAAVWSDLRIGYSRLRGG